MYFHRGMIERCLGDREVAWALVPARRRSQPRLLGALVAGRSEVRQTIELMERGGLHDPAAYALGALDDHERDEFEAHLAECDDCRAELADFRETASMLAHAVEGPALRLTRCASASSTLPGKSVLPRASSSSARDGR